MMKKESSFQEKIKSFIIYAFLLKLLYVIAQAFNEESISTLISGLFIAVVVIIVLYLIINSLFGGLSSGSSAGTSPYGNSFGIDSNRFDAIRNKYEKLSDDFIEKKQYRKAAYVQLKLLQNPYRAANILRDGKLYNDAAVIFLKRCNNKYDAADCYRQAKNYNKAITLYKELENFEVVGDIYLEKNDIKNANANYKIVIDDYVDKHQYVKASLIYRQKMNDNLSARKLLVKGWTEKKDAENCLSNYFAHFTTDEELQKAIDYINKNHVNDNNDYSFLSVTKQLYNKNDALAEHIQNIAYSTIAKHPNHMSYISLLKSFIKEDRHITKDIINHRLKLR